MKWRFLFILPVCLMTGCADLGTARTAFVKGDYATARDNWSELARRGFPEAQTRLAKMKMTGTGMPPDAAGGVQLLQAASRENYPAALLELGTAYRDGTGVRTDPAKARELLGRALAEGETGAHYQLGVLDAREGKAAEAEAQLRLALQAGDTNAYYQLGVVAAQRGDAAASDRYFDRAIASGDTLADYRRGRLRLQQHQYALAEQDFDEAIRRSKASPGAAQVAAFPTSAVTGPAVYYSRGLVPLKPDVPPPASDHSALAISHSRHELPEEEAAARALSAGREAHLPLGDAERASGKFSAAFDNFDQASKLGNYKGLARMSEMYKKGEGRSVDYVQALSHLYVARKKGVTGLDVKIGHLEKRLTPEEISKAYDLAAGN
jgi:TPR repeat protein